jgi:hypothetical protein
MKRIPQFSIYCILTYLRDRPREYDDHIQFHIMMVDQWLASLPDDPEEQSGVGMNDIPFAPR